MKMAPRRLSHHYESNDKQHDPLGLDLTSNFDLNLLRSTWVSFDPSREKHNGDKIVALAPIHNKIVKENICAKIWCLTLVTFDL